MPARTPISVSTFFTPRNIDEMHLKDRNVVVIDVLRASTTIAVALKNGAKEVIPVADIESVVKISGSLFGNVTLRAGERNGRMIEGFNLGNSPLEFKEDIVKGKSLIFMTTNGTGAMTKGRHAKNNVIASFVNLSMVVGFLKDLGSDFTIICAGNENSFCIEDSVCAGKIINTLGKELDGKLTLDDAGKAAAALDKSFGKDVPKMLQTCQHGAYLSAIGFGDDLALCAEVDSYGVLPLLSGNIIRSQRAPAPTPA
jgi:2-phosphosulfolactate phosphatase